MSLTTVKTGSRQTRRVLLTVTLASSKVSWTSSGRLPSYYQVEDVLHSAYPSLIDDLFANSEAISLVLRFEAARISVTGPSLPTKSLLGYHAAL